MSRCRSVADGNPAAEICAPAAAAKRPAPMSPARQELARLNRQVENAAAELRRLQEPAARLMRAIADHDLALEDVAAAEAQYRETLAERLPADMPFAWSV